MLSFIIGGIFPQNMVREPIDRRKFIKGSTAAIGASALTGCASLLNGGEPGSPNQDQNGEAVQSPSELPEVEATYAHLGPPDPSLRSQRLAVTVKQYMEEKSDGKFTVNIAPAGEVGTTREIAEQIQNGTTEMGALVGAHLAPFYPDFNVYAGAYMFEDVDLGLAVMDGQFGKKLRQGFLDKTGARIFGWLDTGGKQSFSNSQRPLESLEDFEGLTIRTMAMEAHQEICRLLGMSPEPLDFSQLYEALDQGVIDGQKNAVETVILIKMYEVQDYMIRDEHQLSMVWLHHNNDWYQNLHPTYQRWLDEAGFRASVEGRQVTRFFRRYGWEFISNNGMEVYYPPDSLINELRNEVKDPLDEKIREFMDNPGLLNELYDAISQKEEELGYGRFL